jgi:hypothetical protein
MAGLIKSGQVPPSKGPDENNPAFVQAMKFMMQVLYEKGAAKAIAKQLRVARDKVDALANISYDITSTVDERTKGAVPRELIGLLAMAVLKEVTDIAKAAKMNISPQDAAGAFKTMLLRYLGENGVDTSQLQQGMDKIDPSIFSQGA